MSICVFQICTVRFSARKFLPKEDQKKWIFDFDGDDQIYTDQGFIVNGVWRMRNRTDFGEKY